MGELTGGQPVHHSLDDLAGIRRGTHIRDVQMLSQLEKALLQLRRGVGMRP